MIITEQKQVKSQDAAHVPEPPTTSFPTAQTANPPTSSDPPPYELLSSPHASESPALHHSGSSYSAVPNSVSQEVSRSLSTSSAMVSNYGSKPDIPAAFSKPLAHTLSYERFNALHLVAVGSHLNKGFPMCAPPYKPERNSGQPHPFASHDVSEGDWLSFLEDLKISASMTPRQEEFAENVPIISMVPIVGSLVGTGVKQIIKATKKKQVAKRIDTWNHHFFNPRHIEIVLTLGRKRLSGPPEAPIPRCNAVFGNGEALVPRREHHGSHRRRHHKDHSRHDSASRDRLRHDGEGVGSSTGKPEASESHGRYDAHVRNDGKAEVHFGLDGANGSGSIENRDAKQDPHPSARAQRGAEGDSRKEKTDTRSISSSSTSSLPSSSSIDTYPTAGPSQVSTAALSGMNRNLDRSEYKAKRRALRQERRQLKRERQQTRRELKVQERGEKKSNAGDDGLFRLFVVSV